MKGSTHSVGISNKSKSETQGQRPYGLIHRIPQNLRLSMVVTVPLLMVQGQLRSVLSHVTDSSYDNSQYNLKADRPLW